jgi:hypothetical protein
MVHRIFPATLRAAPHATSVNQDLSNFEIILVQYLFYDWFIGEALSIRECPLFPDLDSAREEARPLLACLVGPALSRHLFTARATLVN